MAMIITIFEEKRSLQAPNQKKSSLCSVALQLIPCRWIDTLIVFGLNFVNKEKNLGCKMFWIEIFGVIFLSTLFFDEQEDPCSIRGLLLHKYKCLSSLSGWLNLPSNLIIIIIIIIIIITIFMMVMVMRLLTGEDLIIERSRHDCITQLIIITATTIMAVAMTVLSSY